MWLIFIIISLAIVAIMYVNRPKCVQTGGNCDSSPLKCCSNLVCVQNVCSTSPQDMYKEYDNSICLGYSIGEEFTSDAAIAKGKTKEEFVKFVSQKCNDCREDPTIYPECLNTECAQFLIYDEDTQGKPTWQNGVSYLCPSNGSLQPIPPGPGTGNPTVYKYNPIDEQDS